MRKLIQTITSLILASVVCVAVAQNAPPPTGEPAKMTDPNALKYTLMLSPYTYHFNPKPTHRNVYLVGIEREHANAKLDGVALFTNSFGQPSIYIFPVGGVYKSVWGVEKLSFKWTAGIIYGYKGEFKNQVENIGGIAPVVVPALSYELRPGLSLQVNTLGFAAAQFQLSVLLEGLR